MGAVQAPRRCLRCCALACMVHGGRLGARSRGSPRGPGRAAPHAPPAPASLGRGPSQAPTCRVLPWGLRLTGRPRPPGARSVDCPCSGSPGAPACLYCPPSCCACSYAVSLRSRGCPCCAYSPPTCPAWGEGAFGTLASPVGADRPELLAWSRPRPCRGGAPRGRDRGWLRGHGQQLPRVPLSTSRVSTRPGLSTVAPCSGSGSCFAFSAGQGSPMGSRAAPEGGADSGVAWRLWGGLWVSVALAAPGSASGRIHEEGRQGKQARGKDGRNALVAPGDGRLRGLGGHSDTTGQRAWTCPESPAPMVVGQEQGPGNGSRQQPSNLALLWARPLFSWLSAPRPTSPPARACHPPCVSSGAGLLAGPLWQKPRGPPDHVSPKRKPVLAPLVGLVARVVNEVNLLTLIFSVYPNWCVSLLQS